MERSGGIATNIGVHFFDMLTWIFGPARESEVHVSDPSRAAGFLRLERARVRWFLSLSKEDLPARARQAGQSTHRSMRLGGEEIEFSDGFADLHTAVYREVLAGRGFGIEDARPSIALVQGIRTAPLQVPAPERAHPFAAGLAGKEGR